MKRIFDCVASLVLLLALSPCLLLIAVLVRWKLGSPVLFRQERPGLRGAVFTILKFRTLSSERDAVGELLPDGRRMTGLGRILRGTSLDELPELLNVLRGEMSLVGPRPLLVRYLDRYTPEQARRHEVRPGITGWAQVNGRNAITWEEKFALDVWYVDHHSFLLDLKILVMTVWKAIMREGINAEGQATASEFLGGSVAGSAENDTETGQPPSVC
jgi:sugar transferase EpsL